MSKNDPRGLFGLGFANLRRHAELIALWLVNVAYWQHIPALDVCDGTSAVGESRHRIPGASVGQPTEPCFALPQGRPYSGFPAPAAPP